MNAAITAPGVASQVSSDIVLKVAATRDEREAAFRLTYNSYETAGLCDAHPAEIRFTPYQLLSTTDIFIAQSRDETISTMSLVRDGVLGLPMEAIYPEEVSRRRANGLRLAEVSCLADRRQGLKRFFGLFCDLTRVMVQLAELEGIDQLLIAVHPRHAAFYSRYMAYERIGDQRDYGAVQHNPAVPLCLDLHTTPTNHPAIWDKFFGEPVPIDVLQSQPIHTADREYFLSHLDASDPAANQGNLQRYESKSEAQSEARSEVIARKEELLYA